MSSQALKATTRGRRADALEVVGACAVCGSQRIDQVDPECNLCRCGECAFVFDSPRPSEKAIVDFYSQPGKYDSWLDDGKGRDAMWRRRLKKLLPHRAPGKLLDVGTGVGQFLDHARPYFTAIEGTEVSASAVTIAYERYGLKIYLGQVEELDLPEGCCDNITLFHVLEHVPDPGRLLRRCNELLRPGGILVVAVPNDVLAWGSRVKRAGRKLGLRGFQKFSRVLGISQAGTSREIHLSHFTPAVLRKLITKCEFSIVEEGLDPFFAASGIKGFAHGLYYALHCWLFAVLGTNRYETIWLVARKNEKLTVADGRRLSL